MVIDSQTSLYCVIGSPVKHSLSPIIHNTLFQKYGLNSVYLAFEITMNTLSEFFQAMRILNIKGCNITLPHKMKALNYLDKLDDISKKIGSVNTVLNKEGKLFGYNTDIFGIEMSLKDLALNIKGRNFLLLGAGGAARAVLYYLAGNNPNKIYLANRTYPKALNLKNLILKSYPDIDIQTLPLENFRIKNIIPEIDCVINATSVGIKEEDPPVIVPDLLRRRHKVFDLTYNKRGTSLVLACRSKRITAIDGIPMLIYQAMKSFQVWTGIMPEYKFIIKELRKQLK